MLRLIGSLAILFLVVPPLYIVVRFFKWSLHSLEKEMSASASNFPDI